MSRMVPEGPVLQRTLEALGTETGMELNLSLLWVLAQVKDFCFPLQADGESAGTDGPPRAGASGQMGLLCLAQSCFCTLALSSSEFSSPALWV